MWISYVLFAVGLICLMKGGDWFVDGAVSVAEKFKLSEVLIGATVVSIGTTLPEVMVSVTSAVSGHGDMAYGNAIGSIICNTALIAAITMTFKPGSINKNSFRLSISFFFVAAIYYAAVAYITGYFSRMTGFLLLALFVVYMIASTRAMLGEKKSGQDDSADKMAEATISISKSLLLLIGGAAVIAVGANLLVNHGTIIAKALGVPETVIALTFVALGTSLPELVTAVTSLMKGHSSLSVGNIIGANLFNLVLVCGSSIAIRPFPLPCEKQFAGMNASLIIDLPLVFFAMLLMTVPALIKGRLYRAQGIILLIVYFAYCGFQFL